MTSVTVYQATTALKQLRLRATAKLFITAGFLGLLFLITLPWLSKKQAQSLSQPQTPNYFKALSEQTMTLEMLNNFQLLIPKLDLNVKISESIDPFDPDIWQSALKSGVAHAKGSSFPDQTGTVYIFGHSTDYPWNIQTYNALFYSLNDLSPNDQIDISYHDQLYHYRVTDKQIITPTNTSFLYSDQNRLILQTCWPPGTTLKRLIVEAQPVDF